MTQPNVVVAIKWSIRKLPSLVATPPVSRSIAPVKGLTEAIVSPPNRDRGMLLDYVLVPRKPFGS